MSILSAIVTHQQGSCHSWRSNRPVKPVQLPILCKNSLPGSAFIDSQSTLLCAGSHFYGYC
ncbi:hypothetical protein B194_4658 [Serratia plymuthica A30]|nr:hypothetical protein B194_4658 [Serratia plymuthica A30]